MMGTGNKLGVPLDCPSLQPGEIQTMGAGRGNPVGARVSLI